MTTPIPRTDISRAIRNAGILPDHEVYLDNHFLPVTKSWFHGPFAASSGAFLSSLGFALNDGRESADCDDLAMAAVVYAKSQHQRHGRRGPAIAVGMFAYRTSINSGHVIVIAFERVAADLRILYWDPTTRRPLIPDEYARINCRLILL
jgi:hypothetical protein